MKWVRSPKSRLKGGCSQDWLPHLAARAAYDETKQSAEHQAAAAEKHSVGFHGALDEDVVDRVERRLQAVEFPGAILFDQIHQPAGDEFESFAGAGDDGLFRCPVGDGEIPEHRAGFVIHFDLISAAGADEIADLLIALDQIVERAGFGAGDQDAVKLPRDIGLQFRDLIRVDRVLIDGFERADFHPLGFLFGRPGRLGVLRPHGRGQDKNNPSRPNHP